MAKRAMATTGLALLVRKPPNCYGGSMLGPGRRNLIPEHARLRSWCIPPIEGMRV